MQVAVIYEPRCFYRLILTYNVFSRRRIFSRSKSHDQNFDERTVLLASTRRIDTAAKHLIGLLERDGILINMEKATFKVVEDNAQPQKRRRRPFLWITCGCLILVVTLAVGVGVGYGVTNWTKIDSWINNLVEDRGLSTDEDESNLDGAISINEGEDFNIETKITEAVESVSPSVVSVAKSSVGLGTGGAIQSSSAIGTGFIIDSENGIVLTNQHVVDDLEADYTVVTLLGDSFDVTKVYSDDAYDIALLQVDFGDTEVNEVVFGDSDLLKVGEAVIAIGNPLGSYPGTVTQGIVSGLNRQVEAGDQLGNSVRTYDGVIQTDAAINFGNSGGPLLNLEGQVIGVNFGTAKGNGAEGISFAIPINKVKERVEIFNQNGYFPRPYIGVQYSMIDEITAAMYDVPPGAFVESVINGSPADVAGVRDGDIITEIEGNDVTSSLTAMIQEYEIGDKVTLKIWRMDQAGDGAYVELEVALADGGQVE